MLKCFVPEVGCWCVCLNNVTLVMDIILKQEGQIDMKKVPTGFVFKLILIR